MVNHKIKNINSLIQNPSKVNDKELTYFLDLTLKYPSSSFVSFFLQKFFINKKELVLNSH